MKLLEELKELQRKKREKGVKLLPEDVILLLLYAQKDKPIVNRTVLIKEVFLTYKEVLEKLNVKFIDPQFFGYKYGPFSYYVADALWKLSINGLIRVRGRAKSIRETFSITERGIKYVRNLLKMLPKDLRKKLVNELKTKRIGWDQFTRDHILRYVYTHYKEFTKKSEIKNKEKYMVTVWSRLFEE